MQASPCIRFNKEGILLAVSTNDNGVKILANTDGIRLLRTVENRAFDASRVASTAVVKVQKFNLSRSCSNMFLNALYLQHPAIGTFGSPNIAGGTNIGDQAAPGVAIVGLVGFGSSIMGNPDI